MLEDKGQGFMNKIDKLRVLPLAALPAQSVAQATPIEGEVASNAAAILVLLGIWALIGSLRNLREMRHKRVKPLRGELSDGD
jgi:hypothetical protein